MLSAVLGLFSQDLAVDLGTSFTRIWLRGSGLVCQEPTVVAVHTDRRGKRRVLSIGEPAHPMLGRTPADIDAVRPVRDGQIHDYEVAEALLLHLVRKLHGRNGWVSPKMVVAIPAAATDMERRAIRESCESAGAREVTLVPRPVAAALGADLPVDRPSGHMIVDVGGGLTEVSVLSMSGVVITRAIPGGSEGLDRRIATLLRERCELLVGDRTAEALKIDLGSAVPLPAARTEEVKGRCVRRGVPKSITVGGELVYEAIRPGVDEIARTIRAVIEHSPPELASDIVDHGVVLTGGGSRLRDLDVALRDLTGLAVVRAEMPEEAVITGAGRALEEFDVMRAIAC